MTTIQQDISALAEQLDHPRIALIRERNELARKLEAVERERDRIQTESTERILRLEGALVKAEKRNQDMVSKAAENRLDGSWEPGQRAAKAETERDALAARLEAAEAHVAAAQIAKDNLFEEVQALEQKLRTEWDRWRQVAEELVEAEKREQALATQLDRPRVKIINDLVRSGIDPEDITASLARRDALKRVEALEAEASLIEKASPGCGASKRIAAILRERAEYFHRQAGEKSDGR